MPTKFSKIMIAFHMAVLGLYLAGTVVMAEDALYVDYKWQGGDSPYKMVEVGITADGSTRVTTTKHTGLGVDYKTILSREELGGLNALVQSTEFFTRPEDNLANMARDTSQTTLTVRRNEQSRTLTYRHCPDLEPLTSLLWKLVAQAEAVTALERDDDIYHRVLGAVMPTLAGTKALQPARLKEPLLTYLRGRTDRQRVEWALTALACLTTPEEFAGFIANGLDDPKRRPVLLTVVGAHPFCGNIPQSHWQALCPTYLAFVREARARKEPLTVAEKQALEEFTRRLGETRYAPAIPLLKTWFEAHKKPYVDASFAPLSRMGVASLQALMPYLDSLEESYRLNAIELLVFAARGGPRSGFSDPLPANEYNQMIPVFTERVLPQLAKLAEQDAAPKVKTAAAKASTEIQQRLKENSQ